jgi:hypothetical protein
MPRSPSDPNDDVGRDSTSEPDDADLGLAEADPPVRAWGDPMALPTAEQLAGRDAMPDEDPDEAARLPPSQLSLRRVFVYFVLAACSLALGRWVGYGPVAGVVGSLAILWRIAAEAAGPRPWFEEIGWWLLVGLYILLVIGAVGEFG